MQLHLGKYNVCLCIFFVKNKEERFLEEHMYPIGLVRQAKKKQEVITLTSVMS